ncbi:putative 1-acyl-sn-glycerol-3-phosphate acyltransferase 4, partial [Trifolium pratense]
MPVTKTKFARTSLLVYDVTIAYKNQCPSFLDNVFGLDPSEVHLHIRRIPIEEIPISETKAASWLMDAFQIKDQLLSDFKVQGHFPNQLNEEKISTFNSILVMRIPFSVLGVKLARFLVLVNFIFS